MRCFASIIFLMTLSLSIYAEDEFKWCLYCFDFRAPMKPEYEAQIEELAEFIKSYPDSVFEISGHVDERWNPNFSIRLDRKRAEYIRKILIENYCIPESMLVSVGRANYEPYIKPILKKGEEVSHYIRYEIKSR